MKLDLTPDENIVSKNIVYLQFESEKFGKLLTEKVVVSCCGKDFYISDIKDGLKYCDKCGKKLDINHNYVDILFSNQLYLFTQFGKGRSFHYYFFEQDIYDDFEKLEKDFINVYELEERDDNTIALFKDKYSNFIKALEYLYGENIDVKYGKIEYNKTSKRLMEGLHAVASDFLSKAHIMNNY